MKKQILILSTLLLAASVSIADDTPLTQCDNELTAASLKAVTDQLVDDGSLIYENDFFPTRPDNKISIDEEDFKIYESETIIAVAKKRTSPDDPHAATRYYVTQEYEIDNGYCLLMGNTIVETPEN